MTFTDNFGNEYLDTYIPDKIVGFIGIDPDMKNGGGGGSDIDNHEELSTLLGGDVSGHWHLTFEELDKLKALLSLTFPPGSTTPVFPSGPVTPSEPDDPTPADDPDLETDAGLPPNEPPAWGTAKLKSDKYTAYEDAGAMYYGQIVQTSKPYFPEALVVPMINNGSTKNIDCEWTTDLATWKAFDSSIAIKTYGKTLAQCLFIDWNIGTSISNDSYRKIACITYPSTSTYVRWKYKGGWGNMGLAQAKSLVAMAYSSSLGRAIFITDTGTVSIVDRKTSKSTMSFKKVTTSYNCSIGSVNHGCAIWLDAYNCFCVTGADGVATSQLGEVWTKKTGDGVNIPKDLRGLTYRSDIVYTDTNDQEYTGCVFGWSGDDKTFWKSYDGQNWMRHNTKPIPLQEVKSVAYSPEHGIYCAVGIPNTAEEGMFAYLSKDLTGWRKSKVTSDSNTAESVIWMPSTSKFVLLPTSGSKLYTFNPADWR